jgi:putative membrane protein
MDLSLSERASLVRTRLSLERTLMAWQRTAVSLIGFGFTFYKGVQLLVSRAPPEAQRRPLYEARVASLILIVMGLIALVVAIIQHRRHVAVLRTIDSELPRVSIALVVSALFALMGIAALVVVVAHR